MMGSRDMRREGYVLKYVEGVLKAELTRRSVTYKDLAEKQRPLCICESEQNIANKVARSSITAVFFVEGFKTSLAGSKELDSCYP